jgi:hypothetical protein
VPVAQDIRVALPKTVAHLRLANWFGEIVRVAEVASTWKLTVSGFETGLAFAGTVSVSATFAAPDTEVH